MYVYTYVRAWLAKFFNYLIYLTACVDFCRTCPTDRGSPADPSTVTTVDLILAH